MPVRSTTLVSLAVNGSQTTPYLLYQPPAGYRTIVKQWHVSVWPDDNDSSQVRMWLGQVSDTVQRWGKDIGGVQAGFLVNVFTETVTERPANPSWLTLDHDHAMYGQWVVPVGSRLAVYASGAELLL